MIQHEGRLGGSQAVPVAVECLIQGAPLNPFVDEPSHDPADQVKDEAAIAKRIHEWVAQNIRVYRNGPVDLEDDELAQLVASIRVSGLSSPVSFWGAKQQIFLYRLYEVCPESLMVMAFCRGETHCECRTGDSAEQALACGRGAGRQQGDPGPLRCHVPEREL
jgi:hypothetical protein